MFTFGNGADYNDASTFADVLACGVANYFGRQTCADVDDLIQQAGRASDPDVRTQLYLDVETAFFGAEGLTPMIPLFQLSRYMAFKPWVSGPLAVDGVFDAMAALTDVFVSSSSSACSLFAERLSTK